MKKSLKLSAGIILFFLTGCVVPQPRVDETAQKCTLIENQLFNKDQELSKCIKKIQELEATNKSLAAEVVKARKLVAEKEAELKENQAWTEKLLKEMKNIH